MKCAKGHFKNVYAVRMEPGEDVMEELTKVCAKYNISHGAIITAVGSLDGASFFDPEPLQGQEGLYGYGDLISLPAPIELISLDGIICEGEAGDTQFHIHCALADKSGVGYGGHFKEGNRVLTTVEMLVGELEGIFMSRAIDPLRGVPVFTPKQR